MWNSRVNVQIVINLVVNLLEPQLVRSLYVVDLFQRCKLPFMCRVLKVNIEIAIFLSVCV